MKILYGTTNKAKIQVMKNAEIKARAYYEALHMPVCSCDSGLYFDELQEHEQPGLYVRRVNGKELTDDEMIQYYGALAKHHGGKITGRYRNAIYFILDEKHHYSSMDISIATEPFILVPKPHSKQRVEGFPLKRYENFNPDMLFEVLGIKPNWEKINYYLLLDELF